MGKKSKYRDELLDELLGGAKTQEEIFGAEGVLKRMTAALVERALGAELSQHLDSGRQTEVERNRRNGATGKTLLTEHGPVPIDVPRDRQGTFEPQILPKHARRVEPLDDRILALYARGMSVRDIRKHLEELYGTEVSPDLISRVTDAVWDEIREWQSRPLDATYAVVWLDALFVKMRDQGVVQTKAVYVAIGLRLDGRREVLGLWIDGSEGAKFWMRVLAELRTRGVQDVLICCCDGLKGFPQSIGAIFPRTVVQTCIVHQVRYSLSFVGWQDRKRVAAALRAIYTADSEAAASHALAEFEGQWGSRYPTIGPSWRSAWSQLTAFLEFPPELRRMVYTTNAIESLNYQLRKVIKTKGHFPDPDAATKLLFLAIRNVEKSWLRAMIGWNTIYNQLVIYFGTERLNLENRGADRAQKI